MNINYKKVKAPRIDDVRDAVLLTDETISERKEKVLKQMEINKLSSIIIYADKEHGSNFEYLTGFIPRFEEGLQVLNIDGSSTLILGNENFNKVKFSRVESEGRKATVLSLPNQPMGTTDELVEIFKEIDINMESKVGLVGWKMIPEMSKDYDIPSFIINAIKKVIAEEKLVNATHIYTDPTHGARVVNNANEIAHYEYGASLASDSVLNAMNALEIGISEQEVGNVLQSHGLFPNVVTISAFKDRFVNANIYPRDMKLEIGDKVALTVSYRGGLSSRSGYAVENLEQLEDVDKGYFEEVVKPYFSAYNYWLKNIEIGKSGHDFFTEFKSFYPQETYGWELCPGHLVANEEWMSSPFYEGSDAKVQSGMIFQVDFIPIQKGHNGVSAESTVALADETLRNEIKESYPKLWDRIAARKLYMKEELNIELSDELLPLASTLGYYRPFLLAKETALVLE